MSREPRLAQLAPETMTEAQRLVYEAIQNGPRGDVHGRRTALGGPFNAWLRSPEMADLAQGLGAFLRFKTVLPPRLSELAIITVGRHHRTPYEFAAHAPLARGAGVAPEVIEAIRRGQAPAFDCEDERAVYRFAEEVLETHAIRDAIYDALVAEVGEQGVVEATALIGYYSLVCMTLNVFQVPLRPSMEPPFDD